MGIDAVFKEHASNTIIADVNAIDGEVGNDRAANDQAADHTAGDEQRGFGKELRHNAATFHADGGEDADLACAFEYCHYQCVSDDRGSNSQNDQIQDDKKRIGIIFELNNELILLTPGEELVIVRLQ